MHLKDLTNLRAITLIENATELFRAKKYQSKDHVEKFIGLVLQRSSFYGRLNGNKLGPLERSTTIFNEPTDVIIQIEGILVLDKEPVNNGAGEIMYQGYGVLEVDGTVIYDGRAGTGGGGSEIFAESLTGNFVEQVIEGISVGSQIDHRIETRSGRPHLIIGDPYVAPSFNSFLMSGQATTIEAGDSITGSNRTFTWGVSNPANLTPNDITIRDVSAATDLVTGLTNDGSEVVDIGPAVQLSANQSQQYRISSGQLQGGDISRNFTITARWAVFYGNNLLTTLTESDIEALTTKELRSNFTKTYSLNAGGYKWICYPTTFGTATNFTDTSTNLPVAMVPFITVSVTNAFSQTVDYKCHRTLNQLGSSINIVVS